MLVRYYQELARPAHEVEAALTHDPLSWLPEIVRHSNGRGMDLVSKVGLRVASHRVDREVNLTISVAHHLGGITVIPISWAPTSAQSILPSLEGDLEVAALDEKRTQLALSASYRPPLGWLGSAVDRALMRRVAEATIKDFLDHVTAGVETILSAGDTPVDRGETRS